MADTGTATFATPRPPEAAPRRRDRAFEGQFINGAWRPGRARRTLEDHDPYTGDIVARLALANTDDLDEAYRTGAKAQLAWRQALPAQRAGVLLRCASILQERRGEFVDWLIWESGSVRVKAESEWAWTHAVTREAASLAHRVEGQLLPIDIPGKESRVDRQPVGVVGVITPWNFPCYLSQRAVAPAIALGNAVVLKPAQDTPVCGGLLLASAFEEAGLPGGVLNVLVGSGAEIGDAFIRHPIVRMIAFTGSTEVGRHIATLAANASIMKRVTLELGGNSPLVVLRDADLAEAVRAAVYGRYFHQGQICMSTNRIIVESPLYDEFVERFTAKAEVLKVGNPHDPDTAIGPVINPRQLERMLGYMNESRQMGARQVLGAPPHGLVLPPHVFVGVGNDMPIARNETFGPIAPIISAYDEAHALRLANDTEYGLSSAVFTRDHSRALRFALALEAGMTHINDATVNDSPVAPFGGEKNSGIGRYGAAWVLREFTTEHWVTVQHAPRRYPF